LPTLAHLSRFAVARSLFPPTTLKRAIEKLQFVQADPIRAPARAQDLTLRHRVRDYRAGDLERRYAELGVEEDFFITYGFVTRRLQSLMHPRSETGVPADSPAPWPAARRKRARLLLDFVRERGSAHPREVGAHFRHGTVRNYWGGSSNATTHLLDAMHYRGMLRVARREAGIRVYAPREHAPGPSDACGRAARLDALVDAVVGIYAPLTEAGLRDFVRRLRFAAPQWRGEVKSALERARRRLANARVDGVAWYWPAGEDPEKAADQDAVRLLAPFDPIVRDRGRFELLWGWVYRFEAYTPAAKRKLGYYALPLLWRDRVVGWANVSVANGKLQSDVGYFEGAQRDRAFRRELEAELDRMRLFLGLG
jgi:hypothetical protein